MPTSDTRGTRARGARWRWRWLLLMLTVAGMVACGDEGTRRSTSTGADEIRTDERLAGAYRRLMEGDAEAATTSFEAARTKARRQGDVDALARATLGLGDALTVTGAWTEARDAYRQVGSPAEGVLVAAANARVSWLDARQSAGNDRAAARVLYDEALTTARQLEDAWLEVRIIASRADLASFSEHPEETLPSLQEALELARTSRDRVTPDRVAPDRVAPDRVAPDRVTPDRVTPDRVTPDRVTPDRVGQALVLRAVGQIHSDLGNLEAAAKALAQATSLLIHPSVLKSRIFQDLGILHFRRGEMAAALASLQDASRLATGRPSVQAYCLGLIGVIYGQQGNEALARQAMEQSLATFEAVEDVAGQTMALENLARLSTLFDQTSLARDYFARSLPLHEQVSTAADQAGAWTSFGRLELQTGDLDGAETAFRRAAELVGAQPDGEAMAHARLALGDIRLRRGDAAEALPLLEQGAAVVPEFIEGRVLVAKAQRALGRTDDALATLRAAIRTTEEQMAKVAGDADDQDLYRDTRFAAYGELIDLLASRGEVAAAWAWAERGRARALLAAGGGRRSPADQRRRDPEEEPLARRLSTLNQQVMTEKAAPQPRQERLAQLEDERQRARLELETLRRNRGASASTRRLEAIDPTRQDPLDVAHVPTGTLVLAYVVLEHKTWLFALPGADDVVDRRPAAFEIAAGTDQVTSLVGVLQRRLADRHPAYGQTAAKLYRLLIAPIEALLDEASRLCFLPDGPLWDLPLAVLAPPGGEALAARWPSFTAPSLGYLAAMRDLRTSRSSRRLPTAASVLAVGNPTFSATTESTVSELRGFGALGSLPDAEQEAREIAALYAPHAALLIGDEATEAQVKADAGQAGILHFASHALLDEVNPSFSAVVLAPGSTGGEDGLLEGWEIAELRLEADLVVLAGCQTHLGRPTAGRGLRGLSWAFARAGSPAILASHWEVDSGATRLLMVDLHQRLKNGDDPAAALHRATAALRGDERYQHPFYWAGFTLVGDPGDRR